MGRMNSAQKHLNLPAWNPQAPKSRAAFQEVWYLKVNDAPNQRALWLRLTLLISSNGFRRIAETWAVYTQRHAGKDPTRLAIRQTHDIAAFVPTENGVRIGDSELNATTCRGQITSKGNSIEWNLALQPREDVHYDLVPPSLKKTRLVRNSIITVQGDLNVTGTCKINGEVFTFERAFGMQGHQSGPRCGHSWVWGHCNLFETEQGKAAPLIFEGISGRGRLIGGLPTPKFSSLYFFYQGKAYSFNSIRDAVRLRSKHSLTEWNFQADRGDLSFRGQAKAEHKDFAGLTLEDTDGSLFYNANSNLSNMRIHVYRKGKLESAFYANRTGTLELTSRKKNPYVPLLL